jgi:hypothetical protein
MSDVVVFWIFRLLLAAIVLLPIAVIYLVLEAIIIDYEQKKRKKND